MAYSRILTGIIIALLSTIVAACGGPTTESSVRLAGASPSSALTLCGIWQGYFWYVADEHTSSTGNFDLTLQVGSDSTYTLKWGNRPPSTGTITARGNLVILEEASGKQISLLRSGGTLYGVMRDDAKWRRATINLERQPSSDGRLAAGGAGC